MSGFADLGLLPALVRAADALGVTHPTPVQADGIPVVLAGRDLQATAATGSGKTAAYVLPLLQAVADRPRPAPRRAQVLVLVPTRELAVQVGDTVRVVAGGLPGPVKVSVLHGGVSINPQMMALRGGTDVVVATPGRLLDVVGQNALDLAGVQHLVLDEADRLLDAGFADELARVRALLPPRPQTLLFSATFPGAVQALAGTLLHDPAQLALADEPSERPAIAQRAIEVDTARRTPLLRHLLAQEDWSRVLVFVATRYACDHVADKLRQAGVAAAPFHGDASQGARTRTLADFKAGRLRVLVATDLGARGIDIARLPVVVNHDLPRAAEDHVHRIGRTARAGEAGLAVSFVTPASEAHFRLIEKRQGLRVPRERVAGFEPIEVVAPPPAGGGVKGVRPSRKDKLRAAAGSGSGSGSDSGSGPASAASSAPTAATAGGGRAPGRPGGKKRPGCGGPGGGCGSGLRSGPGARCTAGAARGEGGRRSRARPPWTQEKPGLSRAGRGGASGRQPMCRPPLTEKSAPVAKPDSSDATQATMDAMSSGVPRRLTGMPATILSSTSWRMDLTMSVAM